MKRLWRAIVSALTQKKKEAKSKTRIKKFLTVFVSLDESGTIMDLDMRWEDLSNFELRGIIDVLNEYIRQHPASPTQNSNYN